MPTDPVRPIRRAAGLALALVLGACGPGPSPTGTAGLSPGPTPGGSVAVASASPTVDAAEVYAAIAAQVEQIRGLRPTADVAPALLDGDQLRANLTKDFDRNNPPAVVRFTQDLYVELGLLPSGTSLRDAYLDLQSGQVAGYYSADAKQLFVVSRSGGVGATQRVTYAHEFTHQLQDQHFDLTTLIGTATDQGDRALARLGLIEGDAVATQYQWMTSNLTPADLADLLAAASDPAAIGALERAPAVLRATSLYPYSEGLGFVQALMASGGLPAVDAAFADPPDSTAQVLHPNLYLTRVAPITIKLPPTLAASLGAGWTLLGEDTVGELQIRAWLAGDGIDAATAAKAAAGWAGDRVAILEGPAGQIALAWVICWTSATEVHEFADAFEALTGKLAGESTYDGTLGDDMISIVIAPTQTVGQVLYDDLHP